VDDEEESLHGFGTATVLNRVGWRNRKNATQYKCFCLVQKQARQFLRAVFKNLMQGLCG